MTDNELKFFDPETGAELHRVPVGATIPARTSYGYMRSNDNRGWVNGGLTTDIVQGDTTPRFTREPIAPPKPLLPTEPGLYLDKDGRAVERTGSGEWYAVGSAVRLFDTESHAPLTPATAVPTETWDRLRVLDPMDKRDRVDSEGCVWRYNKDFDGWKSENGDRFYFLESMDNHFGPLRFADEVSDDE